MNMERNIAVPLVMKYRRNQVSEMTILAEPMNYSGSTRCEVRRNLVSEMTILAEPMNYLNAKKPGF